MVGCPYADASSPAELVWGFTGCPEKRRSNPTIRPVLDIASRSALAGSMNTSALDPLRRSLVFCGRFLPVVLGLGLVAAVGRALQIGAAGEISREAHLVLEVIVEGARGVLALHVLGMGSVLGGWMVLKRGFKFRSRFRRELCEAFHARWRVLAVNLLAFGAVAALVNVVIFAVARSWTALEMLKHCGWIAAQPGPWVTILFLKNVTLIPWTVVFMVVLGLWFFSSRSSVR